MCISKFVTLTLTSSNYYMSPLSLSAFFHTDVLRHFMYSLPNPSERDLSLHWKSRFCWHWAGGGEGRGTDSHALHQGRHAIGRGGHRIQKARYHWPWSVGAGVVGTVGGRDGDWEWKGRGWLIFYHRPVLTSITLAIFKSMCFAHSPCGIYRPTISKFWSFKWKKNI